MKYLGKTLVNLYSEKEIKDRVTNLGLLISSDYKNKNPLFIGVLNGCFIFLADLIRSVTVDCELDFIHASSYSGQESTGKIKLLKSFSSDIKGRDVILIEDIIDTGLTLNYIRKLVLDHSPNSVAIATLLYKKDGPKLDFSIEYIGFEIPQEFVVGYGLDYNQKMRNLGSIYRIKNISES